VTDQWHIKRANKEHGPVSGEQLRNLASTGKLRPTDYVKKVESDDWKQASSISGLFTKPEMRTTPPKLPPSQLTIVRKPQLTITEPNAERKRWSLKGIVGLGIVCFGFFILCAGIFGGNAGSRPETITAESQTGITENRTNNTEKRESKGFAPPLDSVTISRLRKGMVKSNVRRIVGGKPQHEQINRLEGYPDKSVFPFQHVQEYLVEDDVDSRIILLYEVGSSTNPLLESIMRLKK
tara:strand:- start:20077 stop:20787 length:711 start_codon:yes stop_codon:yes gene_type:complete